MLAALVSRLPAALTSTSLLLIVLAGASVAAAERPNFIIVLCDDLGYGDLRCYGNDDMKTPNIDRFARQGLAPIE